MGIVEKNLSTSQVLDRYISDIELNSLGQSKTLKTAMGQAEIYLDYFGNGLESMSRWCVFSSVSDCYGCSARKSIWAIKHSRGSRPRAMGHTLSICRLWFVFRICLMVCGWEPLASSCSSELSQLCCHSPWHGCFDCCREWRELFEW